MKEDFDFVWKWMNLREEEKVSQGLRPHQNCRPYTPFVVCDPWNADLNTINKRAKLSPPKTKTCKTIFIFPHKRKVPSEPHCLKRYNERKRWSQNCSLRIATLALPTKRQCMETWRTKYDTLPACMVERLQQHVLNEAPTFQISDAINCFKKRKICSLKRSKTTANDKKTERDMFIKTRRLCTLLGKKVAKNLLKPAVIKLSPELCKISKIIATDILKIISNSQKLGIGRFDEKMICQCSEKIAIWTATVLEDASIKLLEEDLMDLEEEEGPILDLIDDLLEIVMTKGIHCENDADNNQLSSRKTESNIKNNIEINYTHDDVNIHTAIDSLVLLSNNKQMFDALSYGNDILDIGSQNLQENTELNIKQSDDNEMNFVNMRNEIENIIGNIVVSYNIEHQKMLIADTPKAEISKTQMLIADTPKAELCKTQIGLDSMQIGTTDIKYGDYKDSIIDHTQIQLQLRTRDSIIDDINAGSNVNTTENNEYLENSEFISIDQAVTRNIINTIIDNINNGYEIDKEPESVKGDTSEVQGEVRTIINDIININLNEGEHNIYNNENIDKVMTITIPPESKIITDQVQSLNITENTPDQNFSHFSIDSHQDNVHNVSGYMNKKVSFSQTDLASLSQMKNRNDKSYINGTVKQYNDNVHKVLNPANSKITFSLPNSILLRNVDEIWPADLQKPTVKITESISRSITSLGKIFESDEQLSLLSYVNDSLVHEEIYNEHEIVNVEHFHQDSYFNKRDPQKTLPIVKSSQEIYHENLSIHSSTICEDQLVNQNQAQNVVKSPTLSKSTSSRNNYVNENPREHNKRESNRNVNEMESYNENDTFHPDHHNIHSVITSERTRGTRDKIDKEKLKEWCKNMERILNHFDMWTDWFEALSREMMQLTQKKDQSNTATHTDLTISNLLERRTRISSNKERIDMYWTKLKVNVDKDAVLWKQVHMEAYMMLKKYNEISKGETRARRWKCCNCYKTIFEH